MSVIRVEHTYNLNGEIDVQGSKNAVLPMLAASVLNKGVTVICGCPNIADVRSTIEILDYMGCSIKWDADNIIVDATHIERNNIPAELSCKLRSSIIFMGAVLARCGEVEIAYPGGCCIGARPIDIHVSSLRKMNVIIEDKDDIITAETKDLVGHHIKLKFPSVGATQNILLCAVKAKGKTIIDNYAKEPEIFEFCRFLSGMGAQISISQKSIVVNGVDNLHDSQYTVCGDRIVAGTYLFMTAAVGGSVTINNVDSSQLTNVLRKLVATGCEIYISNDSIRIERKAEKRIRSLPYVETLPFPGYPTDLQAFMTVLMSVGDGMTVIKENIFENRFHTARELIRMNADICIMSDRIVKVKGVPNLCGKRVSAADLRDGAALIMAGLYADGETFVSNAQIINRGYVDIVRDLREIGADIGYNQEMIE